MEGKEIAVICAVPPGINPGMSSVDLSLKILLKKLKLLDKVDFFHLYRFFKYQETSSDQIIKYELIPDDLDFLKSKKMILYWGDFLHMFQYHQTVANLLLRMKAFQTIHEALQRVYAVFLMADRDDEVIKKKLSFGSTLIFNSSFDEGDTQYGPALKRFISHGHIWFRDVFSALKASHLTNDYKSNFLGIDCATLIDPVELNYPGLGLNKENKIGIFIGRTLYHLTEVLNFAQRISDLFQKELQWIQWGDSSAFPFLSEIAIDPSYLNIKNFTEKGIDNPVSAIRALKEFDFIITDTYHIAVNAWNIGVPTICIAGDDQNTGRNVNSGSFFSRRDKRIVFYSMYDALDFLVPYQELDKPELLDNRLTHIVEIIRSGTIQQYIHQKIRKHSKYSEGMLTEAISLQLNH